MFFRKPKVVIRGISKIDCVTRAESLGYTVHNFKPTNEIKHIASAVSFKEKKIYINDSLKTFERISETYKCVCQILSSDNEDTIINKCSFEITEYKNGNVFVHSR